jgi:hypothetical protein
MTSLNQKRKKFPLVKPGSGRVKEVSINTSLVPFLVISCIIYIVRSYPQFTNPQLFAEDLTILKLVADGELFNSNASIAGQSIWISALPIVMGAYFLEFLPFIASISALLIYFSTICIFSILPSSFLSDKSKKLFLVLLPLVPMYPETFGVALYNFWWVSLWPIAIIFSTKVEKNLVLKCGIILVSCLTSLVAAVLSLFFVYKMLRGRSRYHTVLSFSALPGFFMQAHSYFSSSRTSFDLDDIEKYFLGPLSIVGDFFLGALLLPSSWQRPSNHLPSIALGATFLMVALLAILKLDRLLRNQSLIALFLPFFLAVLSVQARPKDIWLLHPFWAGPRYFFLPWVALIFFIAGIVGKDLASRSLKTVLIFGQLVSLTLLYVSFFRTEPTKNIDWRAEVRLCASSESNQFDLYAQSDGLHELWVYPFASSWCKERL